MEQVLKELEQINTSLDEIHTELTEIKIRLEMDNVRKRNEFIRRGILFPFVPDSRPKLPLNRSIERKPSAVADK